MENERSAIGSEEQAETPEREGNAELVGEVGKLAPDLIGFLTELGARSRFVFESTRELLEVHYSCRLALNRYESTHQIG